LKMLASVPGASTRSTNAEGIKLREMSTKSGDDQSPGRIEVP